MQKILIIFIILFSIYNILNNRRKREAFDIIVSWSIEGSNLIYDITYEDIMKLSGKKFHLKKLTKEFVEKELGYEQ